MKVKYKHIKIKDKVVDFYFKMYIQLIVKNLINFFQIFKNNEKLKNL